MRRRLLPSLLLASSLGLAACGDATDTAAPTTTDSPAPTSEAAVTSSPTSEAAVTSSPTDTATAAPTPEASPEPTETAATDAAGDCSAAGMAVDGTISEQLPEEARSTAEFLLDAALRCDEQLLATAAAESDTTLTFGGADPYEFFGLPDDDPRIYEIIVTLLTQTPYAAEADDSVPATFAWPRVHTGDWADADEAWQEVVDAGLLTADEAADMRAGGSGYLGWRLGISGDGTWLFLVAGD